METNISRETVFVPDVITAARNVDADSIVSRTICRNRDARVIVFGFAPGQELSEHTAAKPAMLHFLHGAATLTLGDESREVATGAFAYMPPNLPHSIVAHSETVMLLVMLEQAG